MRKILAALFLLAMSPLSHANAEEWRYWTENGRVQTIWRASLESEDTYQIGDQTGGMFLYVIDNSRNAGPIVGVFASSPLENRVRLAFDGDALHPLEPRAEWRRKVLFIHDSAFIGRLQSAQTLVLELDLLEYGVRQFRFNVAGFRLQGPHSQPEPPGN